VTGTGEPTPQLSVGIVTFRRPRQLDGVLGSLDAQSLRPGTVTVFDNGSDAEVRAVCAEHGARYLNGGANLGPAGGSAVLMAQFVAEGGPGSWFLRLDDDRGVQHPDLLRSLLGVAAVLEQADPALGGVGLGGARLDRHRWRLRRPAPTDARRVGATTAFPVDYLASGLFPLWPWRALEQCGVMDADLFFGFEEVEFGLRLVDGSRTLYEVDLGDLHHHPPSVRRRLQFLDDPVNWRRYYAVRNEIVLARRHARWPTAARVTLQRGVAQVLARLALRPRRGVTDLGLTAPAILDGWAGRLGRGRIDPEAWAAAHDGLDADGSMPPT